jgi:hypothetical protein
MSNKHDDEHPFLCPACNKRRPLNHVCSIEKLEAMSTPDANDANDANVANDAERESRVMWCEENGCCVTTMERFYICPCKECIKRREEEDNDEWEDILWSWSKELFIDILNK